MYGATGSEVSGLSNFFVSFRSQCGLLTRPVGLNFVASNKIFNGKN